jgi:hypothetical protein
LVGNASWLFPLVVVVGAIAGGNVFGLGVGLLIVAGGAVTGSIWLIWSSLQGLVGAAPLTLDEALSLGAASVEEEQKRSVLRALKDLEYEREVGKINEADYKSLALHYRNEAKRLLQVVDRDLEPERQRAERLLEERLASKGSKPSKASTTSSAAGAADAVTADEADEASKADEADAIDTEGAEADVPTAEKTSVDATS